MSGEEADTTIVGTVGLMSEVSANPPSYLGTIKLILVPWPGSEIMVN